MDASSHLLTQSAESKIHLCIGQGFVQLVSINEDAKSASCPVPCWNLQSCGMYAATSSDSFWWKCILPLHLSPSNSVIKDHNVYFTVRKLWRTENLLWYTDPERCSAIYVFPSEPKQVFAEFGMFITCLSNKLTCTFQFPLLALLFSAEILVSLHSGGSKSICSAVSWGTAVSACRVFLPVWDLLRHNGWFTTPYALFGISPWRISTRSDNLILLRVYLRVTAAFL